MSKTALITGITGQDGSYLAEHLLSKGYKVHGLRRRSSSFNTMRIEHLIRDGLLSVENLHYSDITDYSSCFRVIEKVMPDEIYHLAAQSHVGVSFENPEYTGNVDALGTLRLLDCLRVLKLDKTRFYQASTSELYGRNTDVPQNEFTHFLPSSPYAVAKMYAFSISRIYREAYGLFVSNGILFNHESPRRGETFVTRKITRHVAKYAKGFREVLHLGSLDSVRDWGHAKDYVEGMHLILQHHKPDDFVLATGIGRTVREFTEVVFSLVGVHIVWDKSGEHEIGLDSESKAVLVKSEASYLRPLEVPILIGDATKALKELNWSPKISFEDMVKEMLEHDSLILNTNFN